MTSIGGNCLPPKADQQVGQQCASVNDCAKSLYCNQGVCIEPCSLDELALPPTKICTEVCDSGFTAISFEAQLGKCD